eukprot:1782154-Heterocapsa_arctica.AAC.1
MACAPGSVLQRRPKPWKKAPLLEKSLLETAAFDTRPEVLDLLLRGQGRRVAVDRRADPGGFGY